MNRVRVPLAVILLLGWLLSLSAFVPAQEQKDKSKTTGLTEKQRQLQIESFEYVWKAIRDKHWDPKMVGPDWEKVHDEFRPKIEKAENQAAVRDLLNDMIHRLKQSHFGIIPKEVYEEVSNEPKKSPEDPKSKTIAKKNGNGRGVPGFDVRLTGHKAVVVRVEKDQPAYKLGVRPGWEVVAVGSDKLTPILEKLRTSLKDSAHLEGEMTIAVLKRLRGKEGSEVKVTFLDGQDKEVTLAVPLVRPAGEPSKLGHLPTFYVDYEAKRLEKNIAYFRLNAFLDPPRIMPALEKHVLDNLQADGFVIDLRGNPGGLGIMAVGVGNWFISKPKLQLGTMITRQGDYRFVLNPRIKTYSGPLAILVDGMSGSTSEILAGGLKDLGRARIFGTRSMAAALPSVIDRLPNGDGFQYAIANYISVGGKPLEGEGVVPDVVVPLNRSALLEGHDPVLEAATAWIAGQKKQ
jgi:carboxyl-terminal processing protease